jgi:hypothetical protein
MIDLSKLTVEELTDEELRHEVATEINAFRLCVLLGEQLRRIQVGFEELFPRSKDAT